MKLSKVQQLVVGIFIVLGVGGLFQFFILKSDRNLIATKRQKIAQLNEDIKTAKAIKAEAGELEEQMNQLKAQLDRLKRILPEDINKPAFMADIKRFANENGIQIESLNANKPLTEDVIVEHPFTYRCLGKFHDFGRFFAQLTNYPRIVNVKGLHFTRSKNGDYPVSGSFIVSVFTYKEPTPEELKQQMEDRKAERSGQNNRNRKGRR